MSAKMFGVNIGDISPFPKAVQRQFRQDQKGLASMSRWSGVLYDVVKVAAPGRPTLT